MKFNPHACKVMRPLPKKFTLQEFYDGEMFRHIPNDFRCARIINGTRCTNKLGHRNVWRDDWCEECKRTLPKVAYDEWGNLLLVCNTTGSNHHEV